jgi:abortive infection bacteriophage resistance protein
MELQFVKPPLTFHNQVIHLEKKGLIIADRAAAEEYLSRINYYRLRGYYIHLHDSNTDRFYTGVSFDQIVSICAFDIALRNLVAARLIEIELEMRTFIAYVFSHEYGGLGYRSEANFYSASYHKDFMLSVNESINKSNDLHIKHFQNKYSGDIPIWSLVEVISMSCISKFFSNMLQKDQRKISQLFFKSQNCTVIRSNFHALSNVRNLCAHGNRIYNRNFPATPFICNADSLKIADVKKNSFYGVMFAMKYLTRDASSWNLLLNDLEALISKYSPHIDIDCIGFNADWKTFLHK